MRQVSEADQSLSPPEESEHERGGGVGGSSVGRIRSDDQLVCLASLFVLLIIVTAGIPTDEYSEMNIEPV